ncbi:MAG: hypothetical protein CBD04_004725 [bacterium TMED144]|nr:MAG: hypothetical protein CBD04_004725 [bacterium TMED144]|tara:strand:+ start:1288 stop:1671 length:384 start_codon:yes stop_codon:yes gene_type:complete
MIFKKINKIKILLTILVTIIIGCSSTVPSNKPMKQRNKILQEEIVELKGVNSAIDIINVARPNWLRSGVGTSSNISVYQNGMYIGGLSELNYISVQTIIDMKLLSPSEATTIYGTNNMLGAIEIRTR